jgi:hypothetical protein
LTEEPEELRMVKETVVKDDGRYIIFFSFDEEDGERDAGEDS